MPTYTLCFTDGGVPATGLTPEVTAMYRVSNGQDLIGSAPAVTAVGGGCYKFTYTPTADVYIVIDGGDTLADSERYVTMVVTPDDSAITEARMIELLALGAHSFYRVTNHTYDVAGNLVSATLKGYADQTAWDADTPSVTKVMKATYDVAGRRATFSQATTMS